MALIKDNVFKDFARIPISSPKILHQSNYFGKTFQTFQSDMSCAEFDCVKVISWTNRSAGKYNVEFLRIVKRSFSKFVGSVLKSGCDIWVVRKEVGCYNASKSFVTGINLNLGYFNCLLPSDDCAFINTKSVILADISNKLSIKLGTVQCQQDRNLKCLVDADELSNNLFAIGKVHFQHSVYPVIHLKDYSIYKILDGVSIGDWRAHGTHNYDLRMVGCGWDAGSIAHCFHGCNIVFLSFADFMWRYKLSHLPYPRSVEEMVNRRKESCEPGAHHSRVMDYDYLHESPCVHLHIDIKDVLDDTDRERPQNIPHIYYSMKYTSSSCNVFECGCVLMPSVEAYRDYRKTQTLQ